jgi:hypothetical protein
MEEMEQDNPSTSTAEGSELMAEPSMKKQKLSSVPPEPPRLSAAVEAEFKALRNQWKVVAPTESQPSVLRRQVPDYMMLSDKFLGKQNEALATLVSKDEEKVDENGVVTKTNKGVGFNTTESDRRIVGIVQPFGAGKTKTALMLSHAFVVLPIQWRMGTKEHPLKVMLEITETALFDSINLNTVELGTVQNFSARCQRLTELALLSVAAVFGMCASQTTWFDVHNKEHRLQFALLAVSPGSALISEIVNWFKTYVEVTCDWKQFEQLRERELNVVPATTDLRLVFVMDEVQWLFGEKSGGKCQGYFLHQDLEPQAATLLVENWKIETVNKMPTGRSGRCTDLFYQFGHVMKTWMGVKCAFVMCSTMYSTWTQIQSMSSPIGRDFLCRFTDTHWLSPSDCKELIQHYFAVNDQQLDDALDLKLCSRPAFACGFVKQLSLNLNMLKSAPLNVAGWLKTSYEQTIRDATFRLCLAVDSAMFKFPEAMDYLVTHIRLCAGIIEGADTSIWSGEDGLEHAAKEHKRWKNKVELVSLGLLKLKGSIYATDKVEVADLLTERIVLQRYAKLDKNKQVIELSAIRQTLAEDLISITPQDTSHKGFVFEQVLSYLAIKGFTVRKYAADGTVTKECVMSTAKFAAQYKQLNMKIESLTEESEPSFVCDLLSGRESLPQYVYLPTTSCKPDVLFRGYKTIDQHWGGAVNVVIQSKMEKSVLDYSEFVKALATLDPDKMYGDAEEKKSAWQARRGTLHEVEFMRIVFAAAGFNAKVQHVVHEYNLQQARVATPTNKPSFVHLVNLDDLQELLGSTLYDKAKLLLSTDVRRDLVENGEMSVYELGWKRAAKEALTKDGLVKLCSSWGILPDKTENTAKSDEALRKELEEHEKTLAKCVRELAISLDVDAASAQGTI